jgi:hypothetical protein
MVRALRLAAMICALLLPLASCDVLFSGVFSPAIAQVTARADLSASIAAAPAGSFSLSTVSAGGNEYVLLFSAMAFDSTKNHLIVMDSHLNVLNSFTLDALDALPSAADPFGNGNSFGQISAMTGVNGQVLIGNIWFDASPAGFSFSHKVSGPTFCLSGPSVADMSSPGFNEINFTIFSGNLVYTQYDSAWGWLAGPFAPLGTPSPPPSGLLNLANVFADPDSAASPDVLVFQDSGGSGPSHMYFLRMPKADIIINTPPYFAIGTDPDIFTHASLNYPPIVVKSNLSSQALAFSRAGIFAYDFQSDSLVRFTLDAPDSVSSLPLKDVNGMKLAAGISGSYCVVWDPVSRTLTRYEQWW